MYKLIAPAFVVLAAVGLTACGGEDGGENGNGGSSSAGAPPVCSEVWVAGETLPADYDGCYTDGGDVGYTPVYDCANGDKWLIGPEGSGLHAVQGGTIETVKGGEVSMSDAPCKMA